MGADWAPLIDMAPSSEGTHTGTIFLATPIHPQQTFSAVWGLSVQAGKLPGLRPRFSVLFSGFCAQGLRVQGSGIKVESFGFKVLGSGLRVQDLEFWS